MKLIYGCSNCSDRKYKELFSDKKIAVMQSGQKYHKLLMKGLVLSGADTLAVSGLPVNRAVTKKLIINEKDEIEDGISFHYYKSLNFPFLRQFTIFFGALNSVMRFKKKKDKTFVLCDIMNVANAYGLMLGAKLRKIPIVFIVLDLPDMNTENSALRKLNNFLFKKADGFLFLTEAMNERVNKKHVPHIVLEGHVDIELKPALSALKTEEATGEKIIIYAGGVRKKYGIKDLAEGFILADIKDGELRIYGDGDFREELEEIAKENKGIKYMGICQNEEIVKEELKAALLVNPRPSDEEYTKYSFPSKNMEYMVSGTPVLTTKLPGMPDEYLPHVYLIEDETAEGVSNALKAVFSETREAREEKGKSAREFVLKNKSNVAQAKRIIDFLEKEFK